MEPPPEDSTDASSIKPVSSLRSLFEDKSKAQGPPTKPPVPANKPTLPLPLPGQDGMRGRNDGRMSLDIPRPLSSRTSPTRQPQRSDGSPTPTERSSRAVSQGTAKQRPISMGPLHQPSRSPPRVTIQSPSSPPKVTASPATLHTPTVSRSVHDFWHNATGRSNSPGPDEKRNFKIPSRAPTPSFDGKHAPVLHSTTGGGPTSDPRKSESPPLRAVPSQSPVPPPVDRSQKPKAFSRSPSLAGRKVSEALAPSDAGGDTADERISPFSTPPSDNDSFPGSEPTPPPIPELSKPRQPSSTRREGYFGPPLNTQVERGRRGRETAPPITWRSPFARTTAQARSSQPVDDDDSPEARPNLPPRRDISQADPRNGISKPPPPEPPVRRSLDSVPTYGTLASGTGAAKLVADTNARFAPPPKRTETIAATSTVASAVAPPPSLPRSSTDGHRELAARIKPQLNAYADGADSDDEDVLTDKAIPALTDYPDSSQANRRPPVFKDHLKEIQTKYDTKLFAVCGEMVCTSGYITRVWNLLTGELVMNLSHGETVKVTAMAFKPTPEVEDEGKRIWLGTNSGDIHEVDIPSQNVVSTKSNAHARREIVRIYRNVGDIWTLDDDGKLLVWPPDEDGAPSLTCTPYTCRVPKGHSFSILAGGHLWLATGKDIRVFTWDANAKTMNPVLQKPLSQPNAGEVTSGALISAQPDRLFFGHIDGKITVYSRKSYECLGVVNVSLYKISSLVGVGEYLWAAYNTGMIYVYDTSKQPWSVKKDWHAHGGTIAGVMVDKTSVWKLGRLQVVSLGTDNLVKIWDGLLHDDWLELDMQEHDTEYCDFREVTALVMTWNAGASKPTSLRHDEQDSNFFRDLLTSIDSRPEILVFGFQELVDLEDKKVTAKSFFKSKKKKDDTTRQEHMSHQYRAWRDHLTTEISQYLPATSGEGYTLLHTANLIGLFTCVFVRQGERARIRDISAAQVKLGMGGLHGNKGALIVRFILDDSSVCFINCHLAAGQTQTVHRNNDIATIMETQALPAQLSSSARADTFVGGGDGSMILDHEICILNGDLNYRIDTMSRETVVREVKAGNLTKLLERDQLLLSRKRNPGFRLRPFTEAPITFAPTYKYDVGTDNYDSSDKKRSPAWCDRLLYRGIGRIKMMEYKRHEVRVSDHRPVSGVFKIRVKTINPKRKAKSREQSEARFEKVRQRWGEVVKLDYLVNTFGLSQKEAQKLLNQ